MELSFNVNTGKFVFDEDGNGFRVKASKFPWHAALFSGSALRCGPPMDKGMASVFGTEGRGFEPPGAAGRAPGTLMYYVRTRN